MRYDKDSFYEEDLIDGDPELICKPYQIDSVVFVEDVTFNDSHFSEMMIKQQKIKAAMKHEQGIGLSKTIEFWNECGYYSDNIPFNNTDKRLVEIHKHILDTYPMDFLPVQWENKEWDLVSKEFDAEMFYDFKSWSAPFRVLDRKNVDFTYSPFRKNIVRFDGCEMYVSLDDKPADEIFTIMNQKLEEFINPGKNEHDEKYDHIRISKRKDNPEYVEYVNPSPLKEGYLRLNTTINQQLQLIPNRDIPIREYNEPLMYCLYRELGDDEATDETYQDFKPRYKQGDKVILKPSEWRMAQWDYVGEYDEDGKQYQKLEGKELEYSWIKTIKEEPYFKNYTIKWENNVLWCNPNKTLEQRTFYIVSIDFREDHFIYHSYRPDEDGTIDTQILREEEIMSKVSDDLDVSDNIVSVEVD